MIITPEPWNSRSGRFALAIALFGAALEASDVARSPWFNWGVGRLHFGGIMFLKLPRMALLYALAVTLFTMCGRPPNEPLRRAFALGGLFGLVILWGGWLCAAATEGGPATDYQLVGMLSCSGAALAWLAVWGTARPPARILAMRGLFLLTIPLLGVLGGLLGRWLWRVFS